MAPTFSLLAVLLVAMFLGADGNGYYQPYGYEEDFDGDVSFKEVEERCQNDPTAVFAHSGQCQLYYNCSGSSLFSWKYLDECSYPQLFSTVTLRCQPFDDVTCGNRVEHVDCGDYLRGKCYRSHCIPCHFHGRPNCTGHPDGLNVYQGREWSPYYAVCRSQRSVDTGYCPRRSDLSMPQLFHPDKRRCVSLYEIPEEHHGYAFNCTQKADDLHLDDITDRPDVYYRCHQGEMVCVQRCQDGFYFDESRFLCSENPVKNRIMYPHGRETSQ